MGVSLMVHSGLINHNVVELGLMLNCGTDAEVLEWRRGGPKGVLRNITLLVDSVAVTLEEQMGTYDNFVYDSLISYLPA